MSIAVIVPARDAAATLEETLASLRAQTLREFEAVIVDDGSRDETPEIAERSARSDARLRALHLGGLGLSAARNAGIAATRAPWLLFLDADDLIEPDHLQRLLGAVRADSALDAVYSGWTRLAPDGPCSVESCRTDSGDLFPLLAQRALFPVHSALVSRAALERAGPFDPALATCEDWDLWQRVARSGARFGQLPGASALYRMRAGSLSMDPQAMLRDGLHVIARGHRADSRVVRPAPEHARGLARGGEPLAQLRYVSWCAGLALGRAEDPLPLLAAVPGEPEPLLEPHWAAEALFFAAPLARCQRVDAWPSFWASLEAPAAAYLDALEQRAQAPAFARRAARWLERLVLRHAPAPRPLALGRSWAVCTEVSAPLADLEPPAGCERVYVEVSAAGTALGRLELPLCDGALPAYVLADAIAAEFAWPILGAFSAHALASELRVVQESRGAELWRGPLRLASGLPREGAALRSAVHERAGWALFLQELWGRPDWPVERFYDGSGRESSRHERCAADGTIELELADELPQLLGVGERGVCVRAAVGGAVIGSVRLEANGGRVSAPQLIAALSRAGGLELCRAAVREALIGQSWEGDSGLRERLRARAAAAHAHAAAAAAPGALLLPRRSAAICGTSASRRAQLPLAAQTALQAAAAAAGEPAPRWLSEPPASTPGAESRACRGAAPRARLLYAPELLEVAALPRHAAHAAAVPGAAGTLRAGRAEFEALFARRRDPWQCDSEYEQLKYQQTLELIGREPLERVLEVGCAEGHFTAQLAPRARQLLAADISQIALERAAQRCRAFEQVQFARLDLWRDALGGPFELLVCSEVLGYAADAHELAAGASHLAAALAPGGRLVATHAQLHRETPGEPGFDWDASFGARSIEAALRGAGLRLAREIRTPLYRVQCFERPLHGRWRRWFARPQRSRAAAGRLAPGAAAQLRAGGDPAAPRPRAAPEPRLPILAYHRVAADGRERSAAWRISPARFEEQLAYLRESGFESIELADWLAALRERRALPPRPLLISFDDAYLDFYECARPLLQRYGFRALVFAVSEYVGKTNAWDAVHGESVPLMDWAQLAALQREGFAIGSHSATHPPLSALSPLQVVEEAARSRAALCAALGAPIDAFAYPYGDHDAAVQHLVGAAGYRFALSTAARCARAGDSLLALPRIDVQGHWTFAQFAAALACD